MNYGLTKKLLLYFSAAIFALIIIVGAIFGWLFQKKSEAIYVQRLTMLAVALAENINEDADTPIIFPPMEPHPPMPDPKLFTRRTFPANDEKHLDRNMPRGDVIGRRLRDLNRISQGEVWLVDGKTRTFCVYGKENSIKFDKLPEDAEKMVETVLAGKNASSNNFSQLLTSPTITVGVPIIGKDGTTQGALLLHSATGGLKMIQREAFALLAAALGIGLIITVLLSFALAKTFIKPLKSMEEFAKNLAEEKYYLRSGISQKDEIGSLAKSLDLLAIRLQAIDNEKKRLEKMRQDFLASVSHELKTPITVLRGLIEMMMAGLVSTKEQSQSCLTQMNKNILGMQRLVQDLFELSRLQNADFTIEKSELNLLDPLNDAIDAAKQMAKSKNIAISIVREEKSSPIILYGDYGRLRQMFLTVLDNAVKFSPKNEKITVTVEQKENSWQVIVQDKGVGISEEELPRIFEKFHTQKCKKNDDGTGLGLPIASEIARRHDITITCESKLNQGAKFIFNQYFLKVDNA